MYREIRSPKIESRELASMGTDRERSSGNRSGQDN